MRGDKIVPRVRLQLFDRKRHSPVFRINSGYDRIDLLAFLQHFARMLDALGPAHLRNMHQSLDPRFQFYESSIISYARNLPRDPSGGRKALLDCFPRIGQELFVSERDPLAFAIEFEDLDLYRVAYLK